MLAPAFPPSLRSLRAFAAAARHMNVSRAAEELSVTQPAITQQIRALEGWLGIALMRRGRRGMVLTPEGRAYAARLHPVFAEIAQATAELLAHNRESGCLTVAVLATFAQRWLIPRLASFQGRYPDVEVRLATTSRLADLEREDVELAIRFGDGAWPRCRSDRLMANDLFPVASPALLKARPLVHPGGLAGHVLLEVHAPPRAGDWPAWLAAAGVPDLAPKGHLQFENSAHALEAAVAGLGIAIGHRPFVIDDLARGRLVQPFSRAVHSDGAYYVVSPGDAADTPKVRAFRDWLLAEARR